MEQFPNTSLPAAFWDRLLDQIDPHAAQPSSSSVAMKILCGRWFALHRLRRGEALSLVANQVGIPSDNLFLLEAGVGSADHMPAETAQRLGELYADEQHSIDWVKQVAMLAAGGSMASAEALLNQVRAELAEFQVPQTAGVLEELKEAQPTTLPDTAKQPRLLALMQILWEEPLEASEILQKMRRTSLLDLADALDTLLEAEWLQESESNDHESALYQLTGPGRTYAEKLPEAQWKKAAQYVAQTPNILKIFRPT